MYWSAAMSLKTPPREKTPNYGSFSGTSRTLTSASRTSSGSNIRIPQSIPEHQCLLHFASPRLQHCEEEKLAEYYEMEQAANYASNHKSNSSATTTVTVTASKTLQMLLLSSSKLEQYYSSASSTTSTSSTSSSSSQNSEHSYVELHSSDLDHSSSSSTSHNSASLFSYLNGSFGSEPTHEIAAARAAGEDADQLNYWMLERERLRAKRERRHLLSKKAALSGAKVADDEPASAWRTGAIMCSVPLLLIILFAIFVLLSGEGSASAVAPSAWEMIVTTVTGKTSDNSSSATSAEIAHAALRGSG